MKIIQVRSGGQSTGPPGRCLASKSSGRSKKCIFPHVICTFPRPFSSLVSSFSFKTIFIIPICIIPPSLPLSSGGQVRWNHRFTLEPWFRHDIINIGDRYQSVPDGLKFCPRRLSQNLLSRCVLSQYVAGRYILSAFLQYLSEQWSPGTFSVFKFIYEACCSL